VNVVEDAESAEPISQKGIGSAKSTDLAPDRNGWETGK
jgi:hypothetical protein